MMAEYQTTTTATDPPKKKGSGWSFNWVGRIGLAIMLFWGLVALAGPWLAPHPPGEIVDWDYFSPVSGEFWLGTDYLGRDIFSRILMGARYTVGIALALHPAKRNRRKFWVLLKHLLVLIQNRLIKLDLPTLVNPFYVLFTESILFRYILPFFEPPAYRLTTFCHLDVNNLFILKKFLGFRHEPGLRIHARHIRLAG